VADEDRVADELEQRREDRLDAGGGEHHRLSDAGEHGDLGWDGCPRVDQGLKGAEAHATSQLDRPDLGDPARRCRPSGGLQVDHTEGDVMERLAQVSNDRWYDIPRV
jgi:hypothetical protein